MEKLLTIQDVCELLQVSKSLVYKWVHMDFIPYIKIGTCVRFKQSNVERWLRRKECKGKAKYQVYVEV